MGLVLNRDIFVEIVLFFRRPSKLLFQIYTIASTAAGQLYTKR
jgi:hypothetical protein